MSADACFHCGLPVPPKSSWTQLLQGRECAFCCPGCQAVCAGIFAAGLEDYYRYREQAAGPPVSVPEPDWLSQLRLYDHSDVQESFVTAQEGYREAHLVLEGIRCPACLWLNEQRLRRVEGVLEADIDYVGERARVRWDPERTALSDILRTIAELGYRACPYDPSHRLTLLSGAKRRNAERLIFAGVVGMMVMHFSLVTYLMGGQEANGGLPLWEVIGRWSSLLATVALLAYSGQDFLAGAWRDLHVGRLGMDVPIVIGLGVALAASVDATVQQQGEVYFDSIAMFVFFVLLARVYEMRGRVVAATALDRLAQVVPRTARRLGPGGDETVAVVDLRPGDRVRVRPGDVVPTDGIIREGQSSFNEAVLTGESMPRERAAGERVLSGALNCGQPVVVEVERTSAASMAAEIRRLLTRALGSRPRWAMLVERVAAWFVTLVLAAAAATLAAWLWLDPSAALANTISVLIVTCPCALALAIPVAAVVAAGRYAELGVLPLRMEGLETLAQVDTVAFDKTGSLTLNRLEPTDVITPGTLDRPAVLRIACALEQGSSHPVGKALLAQCTEPLPSVGEYRDWPGAGVSGVIEGQRWCLGKPELLDRLGCARLDGAVPGAERPGELRVWLADEQRVQAVLLFRDAPRPGLGGLIAGLRRQGVGHFAILSGDSDANTRSLAQQLRIEEAIGSLSPQAKLDWILGRQREGRRVAMVGDGINDTPTLAAADVSISFGNATELAQSSSDFVLLGDDIAVLADAHQLARRTRAVMLQNLAWAAAYNACAVPAAALGLVPPWAAAIGMSLSSLVVVANSLRLRRVALRPEAGSAAGDLLAAERGSGPDPASPTLGERGHGYTRPRGV